jgi:hypothetical protein
LADPDANWLIRLSIPKNPKRTFANGTGNVSALRALSTEFIE